jgi:hypothetical protein
MDVYDQMVPFILAFGGLLLAVVSIFMIAKPERLAAYSRRNYASSSKFTQRWPFANMVTKGWHPTYLRFFGVFLLLFAAVFIFAAFLRLTGGH